MITCGSWIITEIAVARRSNGTDSVLRRSSVESNIILEFVGQITYVGYTTDMITGCGSSHASNMIPSDPKGIMFVSIIVPVFQCECYLRGVQGIYNGENDSNLFPQWSQGKIGKLNILEHS